MKNIRFIYFCCICLFLFARSLVINGQEIGVLLVWSLLEDGLLPQIRCQVAECLTDGKEGGLSYYFFYIGV